jgi:hypothetical protein
VSRPLASLALIGMALVVSPALTNGQSFVSTTAHPSRPLVTSHPALQASLDRIASGSPLFRQALESIVVTGRLVAILAADQVVVTAASDDRSHRRFDPTVLAEASPLLSPGARVDAVIVVVNLALLEDTHRARGSQPWELQDDLDRILIHEVYGHALPYLMAGDLSGRCADPRPGERPERACAIQRENAVRAELGLGRRRDAGLDGLALTRPASR